MMKGGIANTYFCFRNVLINVRYKMVDVYIKAHNKGDNFRRH